MPVKNKARFTNSGLEGKITSLDEDEKEIIKNSGLSFNTTLDAINNLIEGSDDVVVDINETGDKLVVKLDEHFKDSLADKSQLLDNATLELKENTDGDAIINLITEFGDKTQTNSPIAFKKEDFEIQNHHISLKKDNIQKQLYLHHVQISTINDEFDFYFLNNLNIEAQTIKILSSMFLIDSSYYSALLNGFCIHETGLYLPIRLIQGDGTNVEIFYLNGNADESKILTNETISDELIQLL